MKINEKEIENYLVDAVKAIGGMVRKIKFVNRRGCPDRLVIHNGSHFVELKRPKGGKLSKLQEREIETMREHGASVHVINTKALVDKFIEWCRDDA